MTLVLVARSVDRRQALADKIAACRLKETNDDEHRKL
jgi:hypothetical protein